MNAAQASNVCLMEVAPPSDTVENVSIPVASSVQGEDIRDIAKQVTKHNLARSCGPDYRINNVSHLTRAKCYYNGPYLAEGATAPVKAHLDTQQIMLHSCDASSEDSDRTHKDCIALAYHYWGGEKRGLDPSKIVCENGSMPW